jgi:AAA domain
VARALQTPDISLIQGRPGTGKSRVLAEIIRQATALGQRVLFLPPASAALDRVLGQLADANMLCPVRCVAADEAMESLPPCIRRLTIAERQRHFQEHTLVAARQSAQSARQRLDVTRHLQTVLVDIDAILADHCRVTNELHSLLEQRAAVPASLEAKTNGPLTLDEFDSSQFQRQLGDCVLARDEAASRIEAQLAVHRTDQEKSQVDCDKIVSELATLEPLLEASRHTRWWSGLWWRARREKDLHKRVEDLQLRRQSLAAAAATFRKHIESLEAERRQINEKFSADERCLRQTEINRRLAEIDGQIACLQKRRVHLEERWRQAGISELGPMTEGGLEVARTRWAEQLWADEQRCECAETWVRGIEEVLANLQQRLTACANVVAATIQGLASDAHFGDRSAIHFDLLILEEAELVTESEFVNVARRANRWVLAGQPMPDADAPAFGRRSHTAKPLRPAALRPGFFQRLWNTLHGDPRRLPCAWVRRDGRLACCLHPIPADHLQWLEREHVADRPDIELGIVAPPSRPSYLAEVVFPAGMTIHEAKEYIYRELGELPIQARGHSLHWTDTADRVVLKLAPVLDPDAVPVALDPGVWELVGTVPFDQTREHAEPWLTCCLAFDRECGWTRAGATRWVESHLKLRDLGRTVFLATPYRMQGPLAWILDDLLYEESNPLEGQRPVGLPAGAPVEFVCVPSGGTDAELRGHCNLDSGWSGGVAAVAARPRTVKGGAGFEVDLADNRRLDSLPPDLRPLLPAEGVVNYLESQAVVRALEQIVAEPAIHNAAASAEGAPCEQAAANGSGTVPVVCSADRHCPTIAVIALQPAQAVLLSVLIRRSQALAASPVRIEVGPPSAFRQRECLTAIVSLTRSHAHRAVSFGEGSQTLVQALTRASSRLILVGDPGTLMRRSQWPGELDHQEESDALKERDLAARLVRYIQGQGAHAHAFQLREGIGA